MKWPTVRKGIITASALGALIATVGSGVYAFHDRNAYAWDVAQVSEEVERVEEDVQKGLDAWIAKQESKRCKEWLSEITMLEAREASGDLTDGQRDRLIWLRNHYDSECGSM